MKRIGIIVNFVNNFNLLYTEATTSEKAPLVSKYYSILDTLREMVTDMLNNDHKFIERTLCVLSIISFNNRENYPERTFAYAVFNSMYDLFVETIAELKNDK